MAVLDSTVGIKTICPYCGVGCGLRVELEGERVTRVRGDADHPGTEGRLCRKAVYLPQTVDAPDRLRFPLRRTHRGGAFRPSGWDESLAWAADELRQIIERHGPDSMAFYISGQLQTEDYYVVNKLAKGFLGTNNVDSNSRLCMASAVLAYQQALGQDGPPCAYADLDLTDCFVFAGSNAADCHPVLFQRALRRKAAAPERVTTIAIDPRRTATARACDLHLQLQPGTDLPLLYGLLQILIRDGLIDHDFIARHTNGWPALQAAAAAWQPTRAAEVTGVPVELLERAAGAFGRAATALSFWAMGLNQSTDGVDRSLALINLHLATGQIGRPGAGPFSLTGQPNAMGGREVGGLAGLLPGHRQVTNPEHRREMAELWGVPVERLSPRPGLTGVEMFQALADGRLKAVWIAATNPLVSMPDLATVQAGLDRAELVVVQDAYFPTETAEFAHLVLPAAQWPEKEGTTTSSERRVSYLPALVPPRGAARPDWMIFADLARRLGYGASFQYASAEAVFDEYRQATAGTAVDITGLSYERLRQTGGVQWPCPALGEDEGGPGETYGTARLYTDHRFAHPDGRARFLAPAWRPAAERIGPERPFVLNSGRERDQWHTMTRTGKIPQLMKSCPESYLALHPTDAAQLGLADGDWAEVSAPARGRARFKTRVTDDVLPGNVFAPFHWGHHWHSGGALNEITSPDLDPVSKQPGLKFSAVRVRRVLTVRTAEPVEWTSGADSPVVSEPTHLPAAVGASTHPAARGALRR